MNILGILSDIGYIILIAAYFPQFHKLYKVKSSDQISLFWPSLLLTGCCLIEPLALQSPPEIAVGNSLSVIVTFLLVCQILYYRRKR